MTVLCKNNHKTILATATVTEFSPDAEPYEAGIEEDADTIEDEVMVGIHYCPECRQIVDAWIEYPAALRLAQDAAQRPQALRVPLGERSVSDYETKSQRP